MQDIITTAIPYLIEGGLIALITFFITMKQVKRKAVLETDTIAVNNESASVEILRAVTTELRDEAAHRREEKEQYLADLEEQRKRNEDIREENTAIKMLMCVHLGCALRRPMMGQGDTWYESHKEDPALGADYLPINQLLRQCKHEKDEGKVLE